ncbi:MAG TPA: HD domain-containing phosphohydrolase [Steroidobacteraceae bacterium]
MAVPATAVHGAGATVLIIDDEPDNLDVIGGLLKLHYHVKVATSGERGLRAARTPPLPDVILLDIMMPVMDGYAVLEALRALPETQDIPVIFVTARDSLEDERLGLDRGAVDYVTKPIVQPGILQARVRTHVELKRARDLLKGEAELVKDVTLHALAALAEARDNETGNHIVRTQHYVRALGRQLLRTGRYVDELCDGRLEKIVRAAPLHDIGKVAIPDHILLKPGALTPEEFVAMKRHAECGAEAIAEAIRRVSPDTASTGANGHDALEFLRIAQEIAACHHEKWDGSGYPRGLAGASIPLSARLMALADVFDALTCRRVYKQAWPHEEILRVVCDDRGRHFDPEVVDAFIAIEPEFREISRRHPDPVETSRE